MTQPRHEQHPPTDDEAMIAAIAAQRSAIKNAGGFPMTPDELARAMPATSPGSATTHQQQPSYFNSPIPIGYPAGGYSLPGIGFGGTAYDQQPPPSVPAAAHSGQDTVAAIQALFQSKEIEELKEARRNREFLDHLKAERGLNIAQPKKSHKLGIAAGALVTVIAVGSVGGYLWYEKIGSHNKDKLVAATPASPSPDALPSASTSALASASASTSASADKSKAASKSPSASRTTGPAAVPAIPNVLYSPGNINVPAVQGTVSELEASVDEIYVDPKDPRKVPYHIYLGDQKHPQKTPAITAIIAPAPKAGTSPQPQPYTVNVSAAGNSGAITVNKKTFTDSKGAFNVVTVDPGKLGVSENFSKLGFTVRSVADPSLYLDPYKVLTPAQKQALATQLGKTISGDPQSADPAVKAGQLQAMASDMSNYLSGRLEDQTRGPKVVSLVKKAITDAILKQAKDEGANTDNQHFRVNFQPTSLPDFKAQYPRVASKVFTLRLGGTSLSDHTITMHAAKGN